MMINGAAALKMPVTAEFMQTTGTSTGRQLFGMP